MASPSVLNFATPSRRKLPSSFAMLQSTNRLREKLKSEIMELENGISPATCRKVNIAFESEFFDSKMISVHFTFGVEAMGDKTHILFEEANVSIRKAKTQIHAWYLIAQKQLDLSVITNVHF